MSTKTSKSEIVESMVNAIEKQTQNIDKSTMSQAECVPQTQVTKSFSQNVKKIVADKKITLKCNVKITEQMKKERDYGWEYVEGIFENRFAIGETLTFWSNPFPGDPYAEWSVPSNVAVAVPRWLANHLNTRKYIEFKYRPRENAATLTSNDFLEVFAPNTVHNRTTFMKMGEY